MAATILQAIAAHARERVAAAEEETSLDALQAQCRALGRAGGAPFRAALERPGLSFLCEVKKASPSKGVIAPDFPYRDIARDYQAAGADAISSSFSRAAPESMSSSACFTPSAMVPALPPMYSAAPALRHTA